MRGLVLEGGGAKGAYQLGAMLALEELGINCDIVVGTSIGCVNGAFYTAKQLDKLKELWSECSTESLLGIKESEIEKIKDKDFSVDLIVYVLKKLREIDKNDGVDIDSLENLIKNNLDIEKFFSSEIDFGLVTYNMSLNTPLRIFKKHMSSTNALEYILASAYYPVFKLEKLIDDCYYMDGGIIDNMPIDLLVGKKLDEIIVIRTRPEDIDRTLYPKENIITIIPEDTLGNTVFFNRKEIEKNIEKGYKDALNTFTKKTLISDLKINSKIKGNLFKAKLQKIVKKNFIKFIIDIYKDFKEK